MVVIVVDLLLVMAALVSANMALAWGELGSHPMGGDKSGLAGLGGALMLMVIRWPMLALGLVVGAYRGGFAGLPGSKGTQALAAFAIHLLLGIVAYKAFDWVVTAIQQDNPGPLRIAPVFGLIFPLMTLGVVLFALHRQWAPRHPVITAAVVLALVWSHWAAWQQGYRRPSPPPAATAHR